MALIKCENCGKEISDKAKACVHCGKELEGTYQSYNNGTEKNINAIFKIAKVWQWFGIIIGVLTAMSLISIGLDEGEGLIAVGIIAGIVIVVTTFFLKPLIEWKAYVLKNIYEIKQNKEGR